MVAHDAVKPVPAVTLVPVKPSIARTSTSPSLLGESSKSPSMSRLQATVEPAGVSYAPMSAAAPCTRAAPRWSVSCADRLLPVLIAGLPGSRRSVLVGPPWLASASSLASALQKLPFYPHWALSELPLFSIGVLVMVTLLGVPRIDEIYRIRRGLPSTKN